jgi:hypothetical protein
MSQSQPAGGGQQRMHGWVRPYAVPPDLAGLRGPKDGVVRLPLSVYSSGAGTGREFDLTDPAQQAELYEIVLTTGTAADQARYLHADQLRALWPGLWLPAALREAWQPLLPEPAAGRPAPAQSSVEQPPAQVVR